MHARVRFLAVLLVAPALSACMSAPRVDPAAALGEWPRCEHPWPCGTEWPAGLEGPFEMLPAEGVFVESHDGTQLEGWLLLPLVPEGVKVPVVLVSTPYLGYCGTFNAPGDVLGPVSGGDLPCGGTPDTWDASVYDARVRPLVASGIAQAFFSLRGTGNSGGCFGWMSLEEQLDQVALVEWLASQEWSNGRVGMRGLSYPGTTPFEAAIHAPEALKAIVPADGINDAYTYFTTPQGARRTASGAWSAAYTDAVSLNPPLGGGPEHGTAEHASALTERYCPEVSGMAATQTLGMLEGARDSAYYEERRLVKGFANVTAATWMLQGFLDNGWHDFQEDTIWDLLGDAPKRMLLGPWYHEYPSDARMSELDLGASTWAEAENGWFRFWLQGVGDPPRLGVVQYEDEVGVVRESATWPPAESRSEVLYLADGTLATEAKPADASFVALQHEFGPESGLCAEGSPNAIGFSTEPLAEAVTMAGNPMAFLTLSADQQGGVIEVALLDAAPDVSCADLASAFLAIAPVSAAFVTRGVADLRFHEGGYDARDFPTGAPTPVRVDFWNVAHEFPAGHRVVVAVSGGTLTDTLGVPFAPTVHVLADGSPSSSHVVLPLAAGSLGGAAPTMDYPPRPWVPASIEPRNP